MVLFANLGTYDTIGFSADGINALTEIFYEPPWLRSQFIIWASGDGHATAYQGGAFREELVEGWLTVIENPDYIPVRLTKVNSTLTQARRL